MIGAFLVLLGIAMLVEPTFRARRMYGNEKDAMIHFLANMNFEQRNFLSLQILSGIMFVTVGLSLGVWSFSY